MQNPKIIPATAGDEEGLKVLLQACDLPSDDIGTSHLAHFFVIKDCGEIVGSVGLEICGQYGLLRSLALATPLRGRGLGTQLVEQIKAHARSRQIGSIYLLTTSADGFFDHIGFRSIPRQTAPAPVRDTAEFKSICPDSAICMCKELS
jgi:amino-acid N-acetyltransferase